MKQLDQYEMILQASEYEDMENKPGRLQDFYDSTAGAHAHKLINVVGLVGLNLSVGTDGP